MDNIDDKIGRIVPTRIINRFDRPLKIVSGEVKELNNKFLRPGHAVEFNLAVPVGFKEYNYPYIGPGGVPTTLIGWISEDFDDYDFL